uniref:response regulator n=1 Tax=Marinobacterium profundum TaxID=1714300 RepID=UPI000837A33D|nr:response regulator [Marinobacterium profundum]
MIDRIFGKQSAKARIALGQVSILFCLVLLAFFVGFLPNSQDLKRQERLRVAETVAINASMLITQSDLLRLESTLKVLKQRNPQIISLGVRRSDGRLMTKVGAHDAVWSPMLANGSSDQFLAVPLYAGDSVWGQVEFAFEPVGFAGLLGVLLNPMLMFVSLLSLVCFVAFYFYLGKMLKHLDPSQAIPGRVRSALDTMAEGLVVVDTKQNIVLANQAFEVLLGKEPDSLMGVSVGSLPWIDEAGAALADAMPWDSALEHGRVETSLLLRLDLGAGTRKTFMVNCSPVMAAEGKVGGALISFDDVTLLEEKELELRKARDEAQSANKAKSDFLATMSHEIRTPMNAILGFTELLRRGRDKSQEDYLKHLSTISTSGNYLLNLINDVLDLSKIEAGQLDMELTECSTLDSIRQVLQFMRVKAQEKGLYLELVVESSIPQSIQADGVRLRQILTNLIGNSIKFTESGGVTISVRMHPQNTGLLQIGVEDTGIGMTSEQAVKIFQPFVQADSSITRRFGGTGLGLAISHKFALAMGGDIRVSSEPGIGSLFRVEIATGDLSKASWIAPGAHEETTSEIAAAVAERHWDFAPCDILVVDDGFENRDLVRLVLEDEGLRVQTANNGAQALELAKQSHFDVILMDVEMPVLDGFSAVRRMRELALDQPVVALTAHAMTGIEDRCIEAGYSHYMTKPIDIDALLALMATLLDAREVMPSELPAAGHPSASPPKVAASALPGPVLRSRLAQQARFQPLIGRFVIRCREQVSAMNSAIAAEDFATLADLAHWLKGAGGSIGFDILTEPALQLEQEARASNAPGCALHLSTLLTLSSRLDASPAPLADVDIAVDANSAFDAQTSVAQRQANNALWAGAQPEQRQAQERHYAQIEPVAVLEADADDAPIYSRLASRGARFEPLIQRFVVSLQDKLVQMAVMREQQDWQRLAGLAHWMKGSGGSIGFDSLAEEAAELENECRAEDIAAIEHRLASIIHLGRRITAGVGQ